MYKPYVCTRTCDKVRLSPRPYLLLLSASISLLLCTEGTFGKPIISFRRVAEISRLCPGIATLLPAQAECLGSDFICMHTCVYINVMILLCIVTVCIIYVC